MDIASVGRDRVRRDTRHAPARGHGPRVTRPSAIVCSTIYYIDQTADEPARRARARSAPPRSRKLHHMHMWWSFAGEQI